MKLIVGLGNPGDKYKNTRHNMGFMVVEKLSNKLGININKKNFEGIYGDKLINGEKVILLKPETYMNLSGESVRKIVDYFKIDVTDIIVIHDDLDLPVGKVRLRQKGSSGGQNGIKNIIQHLGTQEFNRIKVGIGKDKNIPVVDYVLGKVKKEDLSATEEAIEKACNAVIDFINQGDFNKTMNKFN